MRDLIGICLMAYHPLPRRARKSERVRDGDGGGLVVVVVMCCVLCVYVCVCVCVCGVSCPNHARALMINNLVRVFERD